MTAMLGIVAALEMERRWIRPPKPLVELSGIGAKRATDAARRLLDRKATALVSWGVAGGLDPDLVPGTVMLPETVLCSDGSSIGVDPGWRNRLHARVEDQVVTSGSSLLESAQPISTPEEKAALHRQTGAGAVDMESGAVARIAKEAGIPFIAVRVVVDTAEVCLPETALAMCDEEGRLKRTSIFRIVLRPGEWGDFFALGRANAAAGRSMRKLWSLAGPDLTLSGVAR